MTAEVLTELVVKLGFITDEEEKKNFQENVGKIEKGLNSLAKKAILAGVAFAGMAVASANSMGKAEQSARNLGTSSKNIDALTRAFEKLGLEGQTATGIINNLHSKLTGVNAKGWEQAIFDNLGVRVRNAKGEFRDMSAIVEDIFNSKRGTSKYRQNILQQWFGIDEKTFQKIESGEFSKSLAETRAKYKELFPNQDEAIKNTIEFRNAFEGFKETLDIVSSKSFANVAPELTGIFNTLTKGVVTISTVIDKIAKPVFKWIDEFLANFGIQTFIPNGLLQGEKGSDLKELLDSGQISQEEYERYKKIVDSVPVVTAPQPPKTIADLQKTKAKLQKNGEELSRGERTNNPGNIRTPDRNDYREFSTAQEGLYGLSYLLGRYKNVGLNTVESIISKWAPPTENNTKAYIDHVSKLLRVRKDERLNMSDPRVIEALMDAIIRHENNGRNIYDPNMIKKASYLGARTTDRFQKDAWKLNQNINVYTTINGVNDPVMAGREVGKQVKQTVNESNAQQRVEMAKNNNPLKFLRGGD